MSVALRGLFASCALVASAGAARDACAQSREILRLPPPAPKGGYGTIVKSIADLDGDGVRDLLVTEPWGGPNGDGRVWIHSGRDGSVIRTHDGQSTGTANIDGFGYAIAPLGDVDGDGVADYAALAVYDGRCDVFSGGDGSLVHEFTAIAGSGLADAGDLDGDGRDDLLTLEEYGGGIQRGRIQAWSTSSWQVVWEIYGENPYDVFGACAVNFGDLDGDGVDEIVVGASGSVPRSTAKVYLISQRTQSTIWRVESEPMDSPFGSRVAAAGDVDGDGTVDVAATRSLWNGLYFPSVVEVFSGKDGSLLVELVPDDPTLACGVQFGPATDVDGDGVVECIAGFGNGGARSVGVFDPRLPAQIAAAPYFPTSIDSMGDVDGDGFADLVVGNYADGAVIFSFRSPPQVAGVAPGRGRYDADTPITITGAGFALAHGISVDLGGVAATNVAVVDDATLTCTVPAGATGPIDVAVSDDAGSATLAGGFTRTPAVRVDGDLVLGGTITVACLCDAGDSLLGIVGVPPAVSIPTPPFDGALSIAPFLVVFLEVGHATDERDDVCVIPNDPALSGVQFMLQALVGPQLVGKGRSGAWTNAPVLQIR